MCTKDFTTLREFELPYPNINELQVYNMNLLWTYINPGLRNLAILDSTNKVLSEIPIIKQCR